MGNVNKVKFLVLLLVLSSSNANDESNMFKQQQQHKGLTQRWRPPPGLVLPELFDSGPEETNLNPFHFHERPDSPYGIVDESVSTFEDYDSERELEGSLVYGIQNVRDIETPARFPRMKGKITRTTFQSLCPSRRETVFLNLDSDYEYKPDHYEEVTCLHPFTNFKDHRTHKNKICGEAGFSCIQLNRTIFLTKKLYGTDCWESETRQVPAGCECMWPKHHYGDITSHH